MWNNTEKGWRQKSKTIWSSETASESMSTFQRKRTNSQDKGMNWSYAIKIKMQNNKINKLGNPKNPK